MTRASFVADAGRVARRDAIDRRSRGKWVARRVLQLKQKKKLEWATHGTTRRRIQRGRPEETALVAFILFSRTTLPSHR